MSNLTSPTSTPPTHDSPSTPPSPLSFTTTTPPNNPFKYAYATLITSPSYLPGALLLAHTLRKHGSQFPLILMYTGLPAHYIPILSREAKHSNIILHETSLLNISTSSGVASRFATTWTKLQVFSLYRSNWERICFLDADMMILGPMDELLTNISLTVPGVPGEAGKRIAANHVCVCNLEEDEWAPKDWTAENCAYHSTAKCSFPFSSPPPSANYPVEFVPTTDIGLPTHTLLNSGLFIFTPSLETWSDMQKFISTHRTELSTYQFPDQDFLTEWWRDRWVSVGWKWNALKTWRYWHPEMWRDQEVRGLHYIVDKPWQMRVTKEGVAGYKGNDGVTHGWWWNAYDEWVDERKEIGEEGIVELMKGLVAPLLVEE